ncbi:hypothetical protein ACP70R_009707 [Stipagrostis hirtigluma subsp. patula]
MDGGGGEGARVPAAAGAASRAAAAGGGRWAGRWKEAENVLSLTGELPGVLRRGEDGEREAQARAGAGMMRSTGLSDTADLERQLKEYLEKIDSCKEQIQKVKAETITDDDLNAHQNELDEKLQEEQQLPARDEADNLVRQRASIKERNDAIRKKQRDKQKAEHMLSMLVGVTKIMPNLEDKDKISGWIVDKSGKKIEKFEYDKTTPQFDVCNELWKKICKP